MTKIEFLQRLAKGWFGNSQQHSIQAQLLKQRGFGKLADKIMAESEEERDEAKKVNARLIELGVTPKVELQEYPVFTDIKEMLEYDCKDAAEALPEMSKALALFEDDYVTRSMIQELNVSSILDKSSTDKNGGRKMIIKAVKFRRDGFYGQPFAMGGEEGTGKFDNNIRYRGSLQNYLIDTGDEVILVDTGLPAGTPEEAPDESSPAYTGKDICTYLEAFAALGYKPEQVTRILLTHKHADHSGELRSFPNAKIYVSADEISAAELQGLDNIVPVKFTDGAYHNFPECQKIAVGIFFIKAKGHTNGNSLVVAESEGLFYMFEGDITYVDEALYENKLSVVFDDLPAARETLDRVREFVRNNPTVYCGTHTPQGYENLEAKRVIDLDNPVSTVLAEVDFSAEQASGKYVCSICGYVYDPAEHDGVAFEDLPDDWKCPRCKQGKDKFNKA